MAKNNNFNNHHIVPRSRGGTNVDENIIRLKVRLHECLHGVFDNKVITEQLATLLLLNGTALREDYSEELAEFIKSRPVEDCYKESTYKGEIIKKF